jgi:PIN domain nuclease of toxin-antitoxin system
LMRLLLDTHVFLWWGEDTKKLTVQTRRRIQDADDVFVSAASAWEVSIKIAVGKLTMPMPFLDAVTESGFSTLPVDFAHAVAVRNLPLLHADPFDRMLVAQALVEGLHLVSRDPVLARYPAPFVRA